jgi:hypothetical protein
MVVSHKACSTHLYRPKILLSELKPFYKSCVRYHEKNLSLPIRENRTPLGIP